MPLRYRVKPWMFASAVWIGPALLATISEVAQRRLNGDPPASARELIFQGGDWLIYGILSPIIFWVSNRWPIARPHVLRHASLHLGVSLLLSVAWATGGKLLQLVLFALFKPQAMQAALASGGDQLVHKATVDVLGWLFVTLPFGMVVYICVMGMAHAIRYFVEARDRDVQVARLSEQLAETRFAALQAQLNPHFLFNTLNTIAVRARDGDGAGTARVVEQLSEMLRHTLTRHQANEVTLDEELELVRQYLAIEQARFSDRLVVTYDINPDVLSAAVPGFAVQHLAENAIRHGISRQPGAGHLVVSARRVQKTERDATTHGDAQRAVHRNAPDMLEIRVRDDGVGCDVQASSPPGHGIANTRERLQALYGDRASLELTRGEPSGITAALRVPYRELAMEANVAKR